MSKKLEIEIQEENNLENLEEGFENENFDEFDKTLSELSNTYYYEDEP